MGIDIRPGFAAPPAFPSDRTSIHGPGHSVQFYEDDGVLLDGVSRFIGSALGAGDAAVVIATGAHRDGLARRLKERGLDLPRAIARGRYVSLDADETLANFTADGRTDVSRSTAGTAGAFGCRWREPREG